MLQEVNVMSGCVSVIAMVVLCCGTLLADEEKQKEPMTREAFAAAIHRGVPREDVLGLLGKPDEERAAQSKGCTDWVYQARVINPDTGRAEPVTVIIFEEYKTVGDVRWADGTIAE
jgi:hypothetical protein